jgi:hypothetical protein
MEQPPPQQKNTASRVRNWVITPAMALSMLGYGAKQVDGRYVHAGQFSIDSTAAVAQRRQDSVQLSQIISKLDAINDRLLQMNCGPRVARGCR